MKKKLSLVKKSMHRWSFTDRQIEYVQKLHRGNSSLWSKSRLAASLGVDVEVSNFFEGRKMSDA